MLTVKVIRRDKDGFSLDRTKTLAAVQVETDYLTEDAHFKTHFVLVTDYKGTVHSFDLQEGTTIYVENLSGKTVEVHRYSPSIQE